MVSSLKSMSFGTIPVNFFALTVGGAAVVLLSISHRQYFFQSVISFFMLSILCCVDPCWKLSPVKRTRGHTWKADCHKSGNGQCPQGARRSPSVRLVVAISGLPLW